LAACPRASAISGSSISSSMPRRGSVAAAPTRTSTYRRSSMPSSMSRRARPPATTCFSSFRRRASRAWRRWRTPMPRSGCAR
jgi:hypothetical protein